MKKPILLTIILVFIFILIGFTWYFFSTGLRIDGVVYDSVEKKPISQASIYFSKINSKSNKNDIYINSDKNGKFITHISAFPQNQFKIEKNGYKSLIKSIDFKGLQGIRNYEIYLEPLTFTSLVNSAKDDIQEYDSFTFRYTWKNRIGEEDYTVAYMIYEINKKEVLRFKYLEDDRFGNKKIEREIIKEKEKIYYHNNLNPAWMKINEKDIPISKLQEPNDIFQILNDETEPDSFIYDGIETLYVNSTGSVLTKEELPINSKDSTGKEIYYKKLLVDIYTAKWNREDSTKEIKFFIDKENYRLYKCILTDESPEKLMMDKLGKIIKQNLTFTISNINDEIEIKIPDTN